MSSNQVNLPIEIIPQAKSGAVRRQIESEINNAIKGSEDDLKTHLNNIAKLMGAEKETSFSMKFNADTKEVKTAMDSTHKGMQGIYSQIQRLRKLDQKSLSSLKGMLRQRTQERNSVRKMVPLLDKKGKAIIRNGVAVMVLNGKWVELNEEVKKYAKLVAQEGAQDWMDKLGAKFPAIGKLQKFSKFMGPFVQAGQAAVMAFQALNQAIRPLIQRQKQVEGLSWAMKGFGLSTKDTEQILGASKQIALEFGASLSSIEKGFKRITPVILQSGGSLKDSAEVMKAISARTTTLGLNTEQSGRYMEAFAQVMGKGKLQSEELNQQFAELDGALRGQIASAAKSMYGIEDLNAAMEAGAITGDMFQKMFVEVSKTMVDELAGSIGEVQTRLDEMNVAQVENTINTLNTLTMDSLRQTLGGIGKSFQRIQVGVSQFFASLANNMPSYNAEWKEFFDKLGVVTELLVNGFLAGLTAIIWILDKVVLGVRAIGDAFKNLPGFKQFFGFAEKFGKRLIDNFRQGVDMIMNSGDAVEDTVSTMDQLDGRMKTLKNNFVDGKMSFAEFKSKVEELKKEMRLEENAPYIRNLQDQIKEVDAQLVKLKITLKQAQDELNQAEAPYEKEKEGVEALIEAIKERYKEEIRLSKDTETRIKDSIRNQKDSYKQIKNDIKERYDAEKARIKEIYDAKVAMFDAEIARLNMLSPAEKRLKEMRKEELEAQVKNADLSEKERLEAQAALDQMERQAEIAKVNEKKKQAAAEKAALEKELLEKKNAILEKEEKINDRILQKLEGRLEIQQKNTENLKTQQDNYVKALKNSVKQNDTLKVTLEEIPDLVDRQAGAAREAAGAYFDALQNVKELKREIGSLEGSKAALEAKVTAVAEGVDLPTTNFAGGPISGGQKTFINELGKEAFLSASGKLSMINAKPWDVWKAPSSGTIIPAHLASQLDIPRGGVNINKKAAISANTAANGGASIASVARAIAGSMGNDVVTNNVTVQSANPTKTASDMLVQLTKLRRRRMY